MSEHSKSRSIIVFVLKALAVVAPALITSYYGYQVARLEVSERIGHTEDRAEAGYGTLLPAVEKLGKAVDSQARLVYELKGQLDALERRMNARGSGFGGLGNGLAPTVTLTPPEQLFGKKPLPRSLDEATVQMAK